MLNELLKPSKEKYTSTLHINSLFLFFVSPCLFYLFIYFCTITRITTQLHNGQKKTKKKMEHKETQGFTCMFLLHYSESIVFSQKNKI